MHRRTHRKYETHPDIFIGFLACISSDDLLLQYSGYLSVLNYVNNDFMKLLGKITKGIWQRCRLTGRCMKTQCLWKLL
ncbi:MAG: DUF3810 family protein [Lachnospiraceae bacterium]|nr:DUF3810 family protein [Lachnospiraceae bacterium]